MVSRSAKSMSSTFAPENGLRWQRAREDARLDQQEAAERLGIHPVTLSRYETGAREIPAAVVERMTSLYGVAPTPQVDSLAYWSGRQDQLVDHLNRLVEEQAALARDMRRALGGAVPMASRRTAAAD